MNRLHPLYIEAIFTYDASHSLRSQGASLMPRGLGQTPNYQTRPKCGRVLVCAGKLRCNIALQLKMHWPPGSMCVHSNVSDVCRISIAACWLHVYLLYRMERWCEKLAHTRSPGFNPRSCLTLYTSTCYTSGFMRSHQRHCELPPAIINLGLVS